MAWRCFLLERVPRIRRELRRFIHYAEAPCPHPDRRYHNAAHELDVVEDPFYLVHDHEERRQMADHAEERGDRDKLLRMISGDLWEHDDDRWPSSCDFCGYEFTEEDNWQLARRELWTPRDPDRAEELGEFTLQEAPPGAMWHAWWLNHAGPDDRALVVRLPDGRDWHIDGPASHGAKGWERAGDPPEITVSPSIGTADYHGFLRVGELTDDLEGRSYG